MATIRQKPKPPKTFETWIEEQPAKQAATLRRAQDQLLGLFQEPQKGDIGWQYRVGKCVLTLFPAGDQRRGKGFMELLGDLVQPGRHRNEKSIITSLYLWRSLAMRCTPREVTDFAAKVRAGLITQQHVAYFISVTPESNKTTRADFLRTCLKRGWSANQLRHEIQDDRRHLTSFGGRHPRPRTTSSPVIAARQIIVLARNWQLCQEQYFLARGAPLKKAVRKCSLRLRRELELALDGLGQVAESAAEAQEILKAIINRLPRTDTAVKGLPRKKAEPRRTRTGKRT